MTGWVAAGGQCIGLALVVHAEKSLRLAGRFDRIDRNGQAAVGSVFEAEGHGETGSHLAVGLAFGGPGADGRPANQIGDILWSNRVEQLSCGRHAHVDDFTEEGAGEAEPSGDVASAVEPGIHDQALPADGCARLFKIDAHDKKKAVFYLFGQFCETPCVLAACLDVVDGAGPHHEKQAPVLAENDLVDRLA